MRPFLSPHGEDCPVCYQPPTWRRVFWMIALVLVPAMALLAAYQTGLLP